MLLKARKFLSLVLLALFASASTVNALPLVWCVGNYGHSAIELKAVPGDCQDSVQILGGSETTATAGQLGDCIDVGLSQVASVPSKPAPASTPSTFDDGLGVSPYAAPVDQPETAQLRIFSSIFIADQLEHLRTVVLII